MHPKIGGDLIEHHTAAAVAGDPHDIIAGTLGDTGAP